MNNKCVFCSNKEIKDREIFSNELAWAFPTNMSIVSKGPPLQIISPTLIKEIKILINNG